MTLRAGRLEGTDNSLTPGSMAAMIEAALAELVPPQAAEDPSARRKLALAIARGVLRHLQANPGSIHTAVPEFPGGVYERPASVDIDLGGWA